MIEPIFKRAAGLDIHKKIVVATTLIESNEGNIIETTKEFKTTLNDLRVLAAWLKTTQVECHSKVIMSP